MGDHLFRPSGADFGSHGSISTDGWASSCMNRFRFPVHGSVRTLHDIDILVIFTFFAAFFNIHQRMPIFDWAASLVVVYILVVS